MHPPLHGHPMCREVIEALDKCHKERTIAKFFGVCNKQRAEVDKCLTEEVSSPLPLIINLMQYNVLSNSWSFFRLLQVPANIQQQARNCPEKAEAGCFFLEFWNPRFPSVWQPKWSCLCAFSFKDMRFNQWWSPLRPRQQTKANNKNWDDEGIQIQIKLFALGLVADSKKMKKWLFCILLEKWRISFRAFFLPARFRYFFSPTNVFGVHLRLRMQRSIS